MSYDLPTQQATILVVDDQATARFMVVEALRGVGYTVVEAHSGAAALKSIEATKPDVVVLDLVMPEMDGYAVCEKIRAKLTSHQLPILMMTGLDDEESIVRSYKVGATDFISKPYKRFILIQRIRALLRARQIEEDLHQLAYFDSLTTLSNRTSFRQHLARSLSAAQRYDRLLSVLYLDLDDFKRINDTLGHEMGDALLKMVASRLQECVRDSDVVEPTVDSSINMAARLGGDEFIILLSEIKSKHDAARVAKRIIDEISRPISLSGYDIFTTISIGIAVYPDDSDNVETLLKHADNAMYAAKSAGKNSFRFYDDSMSSTALQRLAIDNELRCALEKKEFYLNYQPQIDGYTGEICGFEALLRWDNAKLGSVSPAEFIPVAEETGLIIEIGEWVLRTACNQMAQWRCAELPISRVAVNISMLQFSNPNFAKLISQIVHESHITPDMLELEITESLLAKDIDKAVGTLQSLRAVGVRVAIDDFGTGYSSLSYLKKLPVNKLKIDRSFINDINLNTVDAAIATAITSMARSMGLAVIAEGVENEAQLNTLLDCGCREIQGYYFSRPLSTESAEHFLRDHKSRVTEIENQTTYTSKVLFLADDKMVLSTLETMSKYKNIEVLVANNIHTAFMQLATNNVDVFVVDYDISDLKVNGVLIRAQKMYPDVVRIILSGQCDVQTLIRIVNGVEVFRFLEKPIESDSLSATLDDAINRRLCGSNLKRVALK